MTPSDIIKIRTQISEENGIYRKKPTQVIREIYKEKGLPGFYRGLRACFLRDIPGVGVSLISNSFLVQIFGP